MTDPSPAADDDLDEVRRDLAGLAADIRIVGRYWHDVENVPVGHRTLRDWAAAVARCLARLEANDARVAHRAHPNRPLDRTQGPVRSGGDRAPAPTRAVAGEDEAERDEAGGRGHGGT